MRLKLLLTLPCLLILLLTTACSNDDDYLFNSVERVESTSNVTVLATLKYPMSSFITSIDLSNSDINTINGFLDEMQTRLGDGYNPLFYKLKQTPIAKIYRGSTGSNAPGAYNPSKNVIILKTGETLTSNIMHEELIHAGQNRIYPGGITQYVAKAGTPNIEFEAKLTQDIISYIAGGYFSLGAGNDNLAEYIQWVMNLCGNDDDPVFPTMNTVLTLKEGSDGYYQMMEAFKTKAPSYNYEILTTLKPLYINFINTTYGLYN